MPVFIYLLILYFSINFTESSFLREDTKPNLIHDIENITEASQEYFNDIGYWPSSVEELASKNYLPNNLDAYLLLPQGSQINIAIDASAQNSAILAKYFLQYKTSETSNKILLEVKQRDVVKKSFGICSNLYCLSF